MTNIKCENCIFFKPLIGFTDKALDGEHGDCKMIFRQEGNEIMPNNVIVFWVGGDYDTVTVGKNFRCFHFKSKETEELKYRISLLESRIDIIENPHAE